jgi:hypothetical protein
MWLAGPHGDWLGGTALDLVPSLLLEFFHSMLLIIGDGGSQRHGTWHVDLGQGDNEYFLFFRRHDMAHDATVVASV